MEKTNFFKHFQRQKTFEKKISTFQKVYFQINFEEYGATLNVVDNKGKIIKPIISLIAE